MIDRMIPPVLYSFPFPFGLARSLLLAFSFIAVNQSV